MKKPAPYSLLKYDQLIHQVSVCCVAFLVMVWVALPLRSFAQERTDNEEISISIYMQGLGGTEIPAIVRDGHIYLSPDDLFDFLKINHTFSAGKDTLSGFLLNPRDKYLIDAAHQVIWYQQKKTDLIPEDMIRTLTDYYLKADCYGKAFGLNNTFNFRSLSVNIDVKPDLPVIRALRQDQIRGSINRIGGIEKIDTTLARIYRGFKVGMVDWSVISTQQQQRINYTGLNLSLGAALAGGETDISLNYNNNQPFSARNQLYLWRFVNNANPVLRQVIAGKIAPQTIASIYGPVTGIQLTNTSSINRSAFGTYKLSDLTEPGWKVELYVNNELIDYQQADASGFFTFDVPIVYGNTLVDLRFYGPWGEERTQRRNISIPFNFLPQKELEYNLYAGMVEDGRGSRYARGNINYGLTKKVTIGGGMEYLSSIPSQKTTPFLNTSLRLASNLLLYAEYAYGVRTKGILNYRLPSDLELELDYILYNKDQHAVLFNYREERKAIINFPIRSNHFTLFSRLTISQVCLSSLQYTNVEWLFSGVIAGVNTNLTTYSNLGRARMPLTYSILSQTYNLPQRLLFTPQVQYQYDTKKITVVKFDLERSLFKSAYIKLSFERNLLMHSYNTGISLRYDLPFARTSATASRNSNSGISLTQSASGSLLYDQATHHLATNNNSNVGKAGFTIVAYLDLNGNGKRDTDEQKVAGLSLRIGGGVMKYNERDTLIRITNLESYRNYIISVNTSSFENLTWLLKKSTISVTAEPNQFKLIEIPVTVAAEVSGMVYMKNNKEQYGLGKIKVNFYDKQAQLIKQVFTEGDGYFSYLGLIPGSYTVSIDATQLQSLKMTAAPARLPVTIRQSITGDVVDGLEFVLSSVLFKDPQSKAEH
jgi:hypothetical protein